MKELQIRLAEGRGRPQVEYALRYPATESGNTPFDRYWQQQIHLLRRQLWQERGRFPTKYTSEWQLTRQDVRFCSGFLDIYRRIGHSHWSMWRISGTFGPQSANAIPLNTLLGANWKRTLQPLILQKLQDIANGETPFFSDWQHRAAGALSGQRYYLTGEGLCLWFPQDLLAPKNAGLPAVLLPYDSLDILRRLC